jgi:hypothetical protein
MKFVSGITFDSQVALSTARVDNKKWHRERFSAHEGSSRWDFGLGCSGKQTRNARDLLKQTIQLQSSV